MKGKVIELAKRFAPRISMAVAVVAACNTTMFAQSYAVGQQVVVNENNIYYLGKITENAGSFYWVETQPLPNQVEKGIAPAGIMTVDDAKKKGITYKDMTAGTPASTQPKIDIPTPPTPAPQPPASTPAAGNTKGLKVGDLVYVNKNGIWLPGRIIGGGTIGGKATFHVLPSNGAKETVDNMSNIVSAADGIKAGYLKKNYPNMALSAPGAKYTHTGVAVGPNFCILTYTPNFTPNAKASTAAGKPGTVWSGTLADAIVRVTNDARANPKALATEFENNIMKYSFDWEETNDVLDAIAYLRLVQPVPALTNSDVMSKVNSDYINWYVTTNANQPHKGPGGNMPWDRLAPYREGTNSVAENMGSGYGGANASAMSAADADALARNIVYKLIIDAGSGNRGVRGHRTAIYDAQKITYK